MDQTRYEILQSSQAIYAELTSIPGWRQDDSPQFTMTLLTQGESGETAPLDIYVDRLWPCVEERQHISVDGTRVFTTDASVEPDGERFQVAIEIEQSRDPAAAHPAVRVSREMFILLEKMVVRDHHDAVEQLIRDLERGSES